QLFRNYWFSLPQKAGDGLEKMRVDMKPWFELPHNITTNMNTVTSIMEYLSSPVYVLIIITCIFLSVLIIRGLFMSVQDCLDTWFYFERNEKNMRLSGGPIEEEWGYRYIDSSRASIADAFTLSIWMKLLTSPTW
ncbi:hypothetical protein PENTCL1PPCAC_5903, partial [Pristionchus entomophagus]